jgi:DNA-binding transcriptional MerR regulator
MADQVALPEDQEFFKLNEVCKIANVQPYMLRFWGTEFAQLEAAKSGTGQRLYSREQVQVILEIRRLLFDEGLTIAGARKRVGTMQDDGSLPTPEVPKVLDEAPAASSKTRAPAKPAKAAKPVKKPAPPEPDEQPAEPAAGPPADVLEQAPAGQVEPLLAALKDVRTEVARIVAELKTGS